MLEETAPQEVGQEAQVASPAVEGQATETLTTQVPADTKTWYDGASDETVGYIQNKGWNENPLGSVEAYQNLEKFHGVPADQIIKLPKDMSEEGAMDAVYDRLGRPEAADKYTIDLPEGVEKDDTRMQGFRDVAHKIGLSNDQVKALASFDSDYMTTASETYNDNKNKDSEIELSNLKREWGSNFDERAELGRRFLSSNLPEGSDKGTLVSAIEDAIGTANTLKLFGNAGDKISRESPIHDSGEDRPFGYTAEQATYDKKILMDELKGDKERMTNYNKGIGPDIDKMRRYLKLMSE